MRAAIALFVLAGCRVDRECPFVLPEEPGGACLDGLVCGPYLECEGRGEVTLTCTGGRWTHEARECFFCPREAPIDGAACEREGFHCGPYLECDGRGIVSADCIDGAWSAAGEPCTERACGSAGMCAPGQICVWSTDSSTVTPACMPDRCEGPVDCDCICGPGVSCGDSPFTDEMEDPPEVFVCTFFDGCPQC